MLDWKGFSSHEIIDSLFVLILKKYEATKTQMQQFVTGVVELSDMLSEHQRVRSGLLVGFGFKVYDNCCALSGFSLKLLLFLVC